MGTACDPVTGTIRLYSAQMPPVLDAIQRDGVCMSRAEYVEKKYQESASSFLIVYRWFSERADLLVPRPKGAELPYWAFGDLFAVDASDSDDSILILDVPRDQVILFDRYDWTKLMQLSYLGETEQQEKDFWKRLHLCGLTEYEVMMSRFYPEWKDEILASWERLFRHHEALLHGDSSGVRGIQAAMWKIEKGWIVDKNKRNETTRSIPRK